MKSRFMISYLPIVGVVGLAAFAATAVEPLCYSPYQRNSCELVDLSKAPPGSDCVVPQSNGTCADNVVTPCFGKQARGNPTLNTCSFVWGWTNPDTGQCMLGSGGVESETVTCWEPAGSDCVTVVP